MTFTANVSGGSQDQPITYNWTVSAGTISAGQGTPSITVIAPSDVAGGTVTATVELGGLPVDCHCQTTASESAPYTQQIIPPQLIETIGNLKADEVKAHVQNWYVELANNPNAQGYIIIYGSPKEIAAQRTKITNAIRFLKLDPSRVTIVEGGDKGTGVEVRFYLVPPGSTPPSP